MKKKFFHGKKKIILHKVLLGQCFCGKDIVTKQVNHLLSI